MRAWVPYAELVPRLPEGVVADVYDGSGEPPANLGEVEFYVAPYTFDRRSLKILGIPLWRGGRKVQSHHGSVTSPTLSRIAISKL